MDPDGNDVILSIKNANHATALKKFMNTEQGREFIGQYAAAGQKIGGFTYTEAGKYSSMNLSINSRGLEGENAFGRARTYLSNSPSGKIQLRNLVSKKDIPEGDRKYELDISLKNGMSVEQSTYTLGHEAFVHTSGMAEKLAAIEKQAKIGEISSEEKLISKLSLSDMSSIIDHKNLTTEGTPENQNMSNYVKKLNENDATTNYTKLFEDDKKKY